MCNIWKRKPEFISLNKAKKVIDLCADNRVLVLSLSGGEPFLHKDYFKILRYAKDKGLLVQSPTNGSLLNEERVKKLKEEGIDMISISIDDYIAKNHDRIRGVKGCFDKALKAVKLCKKHGIRVTTSSIVNSFNHKRLERFVKYFNDIKVPVGFMLPERSPNNEFFTSESFVTNLSNNEIVNAVSEIIELKKRGYRISNSKFFLEEGLRFYKGERVKCLCDAGHHSYQVNEKGEFSQCCLLPKLFDYKSEWVVKPARCNKCFMECFREASDFSYLLKHNPIRYLREFFNMI
jgi:MoaA/NifB/PqqE/SkfB family radical SAM enzyme